MFHMAFFHHQLLFSFGGEDKWFTHLALLTDGWGGGDVGCDIRLRINTKNIKINTSLLHCECMKILLRLRSCNWV